MGVIPNWRGRGIGRRLIGQTLARAREAGFVRTELAVRADNFRAVSLYEKHGFVREGVLRAAACVDGAYQDTIVMAIIDEATKARAGMAPRGNS